MSEWFPECACVHSDRYMCIAWRTDRSYEEVMDAMDECQCYCHSDVEEEDAEDEDVREQQETLAYLKRVLDEDRLSDRPLFPKDQI